MVRLTDEMPFAQAIAQLPAKEPEFPDSDFQRARDVDAVCNETSMKSASQTTLPTIEVLHNAPAGLVTKALLKGLTNADRPWENDSHT